MILDTVSIHRTLEVWVWSLDHPLVRFLLQSTYAPWLHELKPWWKTLRSLALKAEAFRQVAVFLRDDRD